MTLTDKPTILVVEDDEDVVKLIRLVLEFEGFEVKHAADGLEAMAYIASQPPPAMAQSISPSAMRFASCAVAERLVPHARCRS